MKERNYGRLINKIYEMFPFIIVRIYRSPFEDAMQFKAYWFYKGEHKCFGALFPLNIIPEEVNFEYLIRDLSNSIFKSLHSEGK